MTERQTHYGYGSNRRKFDRYTMNAEEPRYGGGVAVYGWGWYERSSVLAGQPMKKYLERFDTAEEAQAVYGDMGFSSKWTEPEVSLNHLPGEDDPVPGGMYPDDWADWRGK